MSPHPLPAELIVIYDNTCAFCARCHTWVMAQEQHVPLRFVPASDEQIREWAGDRLPVGDELVVASDTGAVWQGADAFITILWALRRFRRLAVKLQAPGMSGLAKGAFHGLSLGRGRLSKMIDDPQALAASVDPDDLVCGLRPARADTG